MELVLTFLSFFAPERIPPQPVDGRVKWVYDYQEGKTKAALLNKPLFVVFRCER